MRVPRTGAQNFKASPAPPAGIGGVIELLN